MNVLLINTNRMKPPVAPIGLDYLADALDRAGHVPRLLDLCFADDVATAIARALVGYEPDAVGISIRNTDDCYLSSQRFFLPEIRDVVRQVRNRTRAPVVLGGVGYSVAPGAALDFCAADYGIAGPGEDAFCALLEALSIRTNPAAVPGLVRREGNRIRQNPPAGFSAEPASPIAGPRTRTWVDNARYFTEGGQAGIETKRGCAAGCIYCADPVAHGRHVRLRAPSDVVAELRALLAQGVDHFHTCDSEFNLPALHALAVCHAIVAAGLGNRLRWYAYCAPSPFDERIALEFLRAGCAGINFGVDHGSGTMLRRLGRHFTVADIERTANLCRRHRLPFMFDLLLGGPGETRETANETLRLMQRLEPDCVGLSVGVRVYAGTPLALEILGQGPIESNPNLHGSVTDNPDFLAPVFYLEHTLGPDFPQFVRDSVQGDPRFFLPEPSGANRNYNYNDNSTLVRAIAAGARGAYWDILRRLTRAT